MTSIGNQRIHVYRDDALQAIQHLVGHGYDRYVQGTISKRKAMALVCKFQDRYAILQTENQRYRARRNGHVSSILVLWLTKSSADIGWCLCVSGDAEGLVDQIENLCRFDAKNARINIDGYELIRHSSGGPKPRWTWRMSHDLFEDLRKKILKPISGRQRWKIDAPLLSLRKVPGFSQTRTQAFEIWRDAQRSWKKHHKHEPWPHGKWKASFRGRRRVLTTISVLDL